MGDEINGRIAELAARLFELRAVEESNLRALTWIQQSLESIRAGNAPGDADLLLSEIARRFTECAAAADGLTTVRDDAAALLTRVIAIRTARSTSASRAVAAA